MTNNEFRNILNDDEIFMSKEELDALINAELDKPVEKMDTELIEYCLNAVKSFDNTEKKKSGKRKKNHTLKRVIAVAAAITIIIAGAVTVSTGVHRTNVKEGIVEFYKDYIQINFSSSESKKQEYTHSDSTLVKDLADHGISPVILPEALLSEDYKLTSVEYEDTEYIKSANIMLKKKRKKVSITISRYDKVIGLPDMEYPSAESFEKLSVDGIDVYVITRDDDEKIISYVDGDMYYIISAEWDKETALEIAKTIK